MSKKEEYLKMILDTKDWYDERLASLQQIVDLKDDSKIMIQAENGEQIELPEEHKTGFIFGIQLALDVMGKFPINITKS
jgi:hypothetical protein